MVGACFGAHVHEDLARQSDVHAGAAANQHVVALDRVAVVVDRHLAGDQADVADIVLRAGMMAAGEMDVHGRVELDARFAPARDLLGMPLGVGGGEAAADIAGAGDEAGADRARADREPQRLDAADGAFDLVVRHAGDQKVLPDREPDIAVAERAGDAGEAADLVRREPADRQHHADEVQPLLLLRMHADMGDAIDRRARRQRFRRNAVEACGRASPRSAPRPCPCRGGR